MVENAVRGCREGQHRGGGIVAGKERDRRESGAQFTTFENMTSSESPSGLVGLSLNDRTVVLPVLLLDKTVSVRKDNLCIRTHALSQKSDLKMRHACNAYFFRFLD